MARRLGGIPHFRSPEELSRSGIEYDGALVCTLPDTHITFCRYFMERKKHVLCEKPMGRSADNIKGLIDCSKQFGVVAGINCNQRFAPACGKVKERIASGEKVHLIQISMQQQGPVRKSDHVRDYFLITDACCHLIDTLRYLNGEIAAVHAFGKRIDSDIVSDVVVNMEFANGSVGTMTHTFVGGVHETQHPFQRLDLSTNKARYTVDNMMDRLQIFPHEERYHHTWIPSAFEARDYGMTMIASVTAWIDSVIDGADAPVSLWDAYCNARITEACIESLETGKAVRLDVR